MFVLLQTASEIQGQNEATTRRRNQLSYVLLSRRMNVMLTLIRLPFTGVSAGRYTYSVDDIGNFVHENVSRNIIRGRRSRFRPYQSRDFIRTDG